MIESHAMLDKMIREAMARRSWASLPQSFENDAVRALFLRCKPYFGEREIKQRIAASHATTFDDLLDAINR